jgi:hypothetical protein
MRNALSWVNVFRFAFRTRTLLDAVGTGGWKSRKKKPPEGGFQIQI